MSATKQYRAKAAEFKALRTSASASRSPKETNELRDLEQTYTTLAENEEWMAGHIDNAMQRGKNFDERTSQGEGFLADVVRQWEEAARAAEKVARVVILRFGVVLAGEGGALQKMMLPFRLGVGGPIGSGDQWMSWVDREDVFRAMEWAIDRPEIRGTYNITSPGESESVLATAPSRLPMSRTAAVVITRAGHHAQEDGCRKLINTRSGSSWSRSIAALVESRSISNRPGVTGKVRYRSVNPL